MLHASPEKNFTQEPAKPLADAAGNLPVAIYT